MFLSYKLYSDQSSTDGGGIWGNEIGNNGQLWTNLLRNTENDGNINEAPYVS